MDNNPVTVTSPHNAPAGPAGIPTVNPGIRPGAKPPSVAMPPSAAASKGVVLKSFQDLDRLATQSVKPSHEDTPPDSQSDHATPSPDEGDEPVQSEGKAEVTKTDKPDESTSDLDRLSKSKTDEQEEQRPPPKKLRQAYEEMKAERERFKEELETLKKAPSGHPEVETLKKELEEIKTRHKSFTDQMDYAEEVESPEFKEKYEKPWQEAFTSAQEDIVALSRSTDDQPATPKDLNEILSLDRVQALRRIKELFPEFTEMMYRHYIDIHKAYKAHQTATANFRASLEQRRAKAAEQQKQQQESVKQQFSQNKDELTKKYPALFAKDEKDKEGNTYLDEGERLADLALNGSPDMKPEQFTKILADVYHRARGFARMVHRAEKERARADAAEAKLKAYEKSEPSTGTGSNRPSNGQDGAMLTPMERALAAFK
jgi:hypothetical protein